MSTSVTTGFDRRRFTDLSGGGGWNAFDEKMSESDTMYYMKTLSLRVEDLKGKLPQYQHNLHVMSERDRYSNSRLGS